MAAKTSEKLAAALNAVGLEALAAEAMNDVFHDYWSPHPMPTSLLVNVLLDAASGCPDHARRIKILELREAVMDGKYDASKEESDAWAASPEGRALYEEMLRGNEKQADEQDE